LMDELTNSEEVDLMPIAVKRSRPRINWKKKLTKLIDTVDKSESRFLELADLEDVPADFMELLTDSEASKIRLRGTKIYVRANESSVHQDGVREISADISRSSFGRSKKIVSAIENNLILVKIFKCGALTKKIPDGLFRRLGDQDPYVSLEVAFSNENINELYFESVHALSKYTTIEYAFGLKIYSNSVNNHFDATLFAMRRAAENPPASSKDLPLEAEKAYEDSGKQTLAHYDCASNLDEDEEFPTEYVESQVDEFGVEVFFTRQINEQNYNNDIVIPFGPSQNVTFSAFTISMIRESYQEWWQRRYGPAAPGNQ
jgi:hypothetical protein